MQLENFLVREPLVNSHEKGLGYELSWQSAKKGCKPSDTESVSLAHFIAEQLNDTEPGSLLGDQILFLETTPSLLAHESVCALPPKGIVLAFRGADLVDGDAIAAVRAARAKGYGISLRHVEPVGIDSNLVAQASFLELESGAADLSDQVRHLRSLAPSSVPIIARSITDWQAFETCAALDMHAFVGKLHLSRRSDSGTRDLNPAQTMILQLMDMVRRNADVKQLESVLKRDAALSYKLLRYINSAGFGLGCEIQSLKHAVTMLGYSPLYRWLALLLTTATTTGYSPTLMQAAVIRGRFAELLGGTFLPKHEAENLFVAGMFSLLDRLLGVPMEDILEKIQLSESITQALLSREGIYGPFLALAEACELNADQLEQMAVSLCISARQVSQAHMAALAWAQSLKL